MSETHDYNTHTQTNTQTNPTQKPSYKTRATLLSVSPTTNRSAGRWTWPSYITRMTR